MPAPYNAGFYTVGAQVSPSAVVPITCPVKVGNQPTYHSRAFLALTTGSMTATFADDPSQTPVTFPVTAGVVYPFSLKMFTSGAAILALW